MLSGCQKGTNALLELFITAIDGEREAQQMYSKAIELCEDPDIRETLQSLLEAERNHEQVLRRLYARLRKTHDVDGCVAGAEAVEAL